MVLILKTNRNFFGRNASSSYYQQALEALVDPLCIIDPTGCIISINAAWRRFGQEHGNPELISAGIGANYLAIWRQAASEIPAARETLIGIVSMIDGLIDRFTLDYVVQTPEQQRWFRLNATPIRTPFGGVLIVHTDVTELKAALLACEENLRESQAIQTTLEAISGLVPICGECRQIRNDEEFLAHLRQQLTRVDPVSWRLGLCPECQARHRPD